MESPYKLYKLYKNVENIEEEAKFNLFDKYLKQNLRGEQKIVELSGTDQETLMVKKNGGLPLPGFIYTFIYKSNIAETLTNKNNKTFQFVDYAPIVFCFSLYSDSFKGINLNLLPPLHRLYFLNTYFELYPEFFQNKINNLLNKNKLALNKEFISSIKSGNGPKLIDLFSKKSNTNLKFAFRQYYYKSIQNLRMTEYDEWKYIPFFNPSNSIKNISFDIIYKLYQSTLMNLKN